MYYMHIFNENSIVTYIITVSHKTYWADVLKSWLLSHNWQLQSVKETKKGILNAIEIFKNIMNKEDRKEKN